MAVSKGGTVAEREFHLGEEEFRFLVDMVHQRTGIVLGEHKRTMIYGRLARRLRQLGMNSFRDYCDLIAGDHGTAEIGFFVNAVTTNLTRFFREGHHFDHLRDEFLPALARRAEGGAPRRLRIWSAGCSSGEEPYTIAMTLREGLRDLDRWDARILATDIDTDMLDKGEAGLYPADSQEGIPEAYRGRYTESQGGKIRMKDSLRSLIAFKRLNLLGRWPMKGPFDAIFCRNVVIYFDRPTQTALFGRYAELLADHGFLYVGHSENLFNVTDRFRLVGRSVYRKAPV
ncbi:MAG: protein-glutamate O-methyltransferase [Magnetospirillum sp. WYHS-4]